MNTAFTYMYRDGDNYKTAHRVIFHGAVTTRLREAILSAASGDQDHFIPGLIGLPDLQNRFGKNEIDMVDAITSAAEANGSGFPDSEIKRMQEIRTQIAQQPSCWDPERDHIYHEILEIKPSTEEATDPRSIESFAVEFQQARWDDTYLPPFYSDMLENFYIRRNKDLDDEISGP